MFQLLLQLQEDERLFSGYNDIYRYSLKEFSLRIFLELYPTRDFVTKTNFPFLPQQLLLTFHFPKIFDSRDSACHSATMGAQVIPPETTSTALVVSKPQNKNGPRVKDLILMFEKLGKEIIYLCERKHEENIQRALPEKERAFTDYLSSKFSVSESHHFLSMFCAIH